MLRNIASPRDPLDVPRLNAPIHACLFLHGKDMGQARGELGDRMGVEFGLAWVLMLLPRSNTDCKMCLM